MKQLIVVLILCAPLALYSQTVEFVVVCNASDKTEVRAASDTTDTSLTVLKRGLPNRQVAQGWMERNHPDGTCAASSAPVVTPAPPSNAGESSGPSPASSPPPKKVSHFYRSSIFLYYGKTSYNLNELNQFSGKEVGGKLIGARFQKGDGFQVGMHLNYCEYGSVNHWKKNVAVKRKWMNVDWAMLFSVPIELHKPSGKIWLLPEASLGATWQNLQDAEPEDYNLRVVGGSWFYALRIGVEVFHIQGFLEYQRLLGETIEDSNFRFSGTRVGIGLAF